MRRRDPGFADERQLDPHDRAGLAQPGQGRERVPHERLRGEVDVQDVAGHDVVLAQAPTRVTAPANDTDQAAGAGLAGGRHVRELEAGDPETTPSKAGGEGVQEGAVSARPAPWASATVQLAV